MTFEFFDEGFMSTTVNGTSERASIYLLELLQGDSKKDFFQNASGWVLASPTCEWEGISCIAGDVTEIDLSGRNLEGTLPKGIGQIKSLTSISLASNRYGGTVPTTWASLPLLKTLDLSENVLEGTLPVMASESVKCFLLGYNRFSGMLPKDFAKNGANMIIYDVGFNELTGTIPNLDNKFPLLEELDLSNNMINGKLETSISRLTSLQRLFLSNNRLSGTIPNSLGDHILALKEIYLHGNILTGTLPASLGDLPDLRILFIDDNKLTGVLPQELCTLNLNEIFFYDGAGGVNSSDIDTNYLELLNGNRTKSGDDSGTNPIRQNDPTIERDGCTSIACPAGYKSLSSNNKDGVYPCTPCENKSLNPYLGSNFCFDIQEDHVLIALYNATNGASWTAAKNWGDASISTCEKEGVTCNANGEVTAINLHDKGLTGTIPAEVGFLSKLTSLDLSNNQIGGPLPGDLHFAPLVLLNVAENFLTGYVPLSLCQAEGINGNGQDGIFTCDTIACQAGFYSLTGRAAPGLSGIKCAQCTGDDVYLAIIDCKNVVAVQNGITPFGLVGEIAIVIFGLGIMFGLFWVWRRSKVSTEYINNRAYDLHGPGKDRLALGASDGFSHPESDLDLDETDPLGGIDGLGHGSLTRMEVKVKDEWSSGKETQKDVWLDVPKIS